MLSRPWPIHICRVAVFAGRGAAVVFEFQTLAGLAVDEGAIRYALFDARSERVYGACFGVGGARVETLVEPHAGELRDVLDGDVPGGAFFVGDAAEKHRAAIEGAGFPVLSPGVDVSLADGTAAGDKDLRSEWAKQKVYHLIGQYARRQDPDTLREIRETAREYKANAPPRGKF